MHLAVNSFLGARAGPAGSRRVASSPVPALIFVQTRRPLVPRLSAEPDRDPPSQDFWEVRAGPLPWVLHVPARATAAPPARCRAAFFTARFVIFVFTASQGESWEVLGKAAAFALPVLVLLSLGVGFFAAQTYENGASVFLESAKSPEGSARLTQMEDLPPGLL